MWFDIIKAEAQYEDHPELKKHGELYMEIKDIIKRQLNMNTMDVNQLKSIQDKEWPKVTTALYNFRQTLRKEVHSSRPGGTFGPWIARQMGVTPKPTTPDPKAPKWREEGQTSIADWRLENR